MASISKRGNRWFARYRDDSGREHGKRFDRKLDAQRWLDGVTASQVRGDYVDPRAGRETVGEYAQAWLARQAHLKPSTASRYRSIVERRIIPTFGATPLAKVERSAVTGWVAALVAEGRAADTVRHMHRVLYMVLASAVADGKIVRNPAERVPVPRPRRGGKRYLSHEQVRALAEAAGAGRLGVLVLAYCGLRFGELAALRVGNVDPLRRRIVVAESATEVDGHMSFGPPKNGQQRSVPVPRFLLDDLARACEGKAADALVFTAPGGGVLWLRNFRRRVFASAVAEADLGALTVHELRHTAASLAVAAGANVKVLQRMLGHASATMTLDRYADLFEDDLDGVADRLDAGAASARGHVADNLRTAGTVVEFPAS